MRKFLRSPVASFICFALAAVLLLGGSIGGTRAALTYVSQNYISDMVLDYIGVSLIENGESVSHRIYGTTADSGWDAYVPYREEGDPANLLQNLIGLDGNPDSELKLGKTYKEELAVCNSGGITEYVRVSIHRYWVDKNGKKIQALDPTLIKLNFVNEDVWKDKTIDPQSQLQYSPEYTVLYYQGTLAPGETSPLFVDKITIDGSQLVTYVSETTSESDGERRTTYTYSYDGVHFVLEVEVHAVQDHNAESAMTSVWGHTN